MPTWLKVTLNILLNVVLVVCAVLFTIYTDVFDKYKKYTYQDLQDAYNTGYAQASAMMADLQAKINELTESLSQKLQQVSDLQLQINDLQNQNSELETENQDLEQQILDLQDIISHKDVEIANLKAEIERLKAELEIYANQELDFVSVVFVVEDKLYDHVAVRKGGNILVDIEEPALDGHVFVGWKNQNNETVDLQAYSFTENSILNASFELASFCVGYDFFFDFTFDKLGKTSLENEFRANVCISIYSDTVYTGSVGLFYDDQLISPDEDSLLFGNYEANVVYAPEIVYDGPNCLSVYIKSDKYNCYGLFYFQLVFENNKQVVKPFKGIPNASSPNDIFGFFKSKHQ